MRREKDLQRKDAQRKRCAEKRCAEKKMQGAKDSVEQKNEGRKKCWGKRKDGDLPSKNLRPWKRFIKPKKTVSEHAVRQGQRNCWMKNVESKAYPPSHQLTFEKFPRQEISEHAVCQG
jgi:hypothetical protein